MAKKSNTSNNNTSTKRVVCLPDLHYPLHDVASLSAVESFMVDFRPTHTVWLGDQLQMDSVSHWLKDKRGALEGQRLLADYAGFNQILDRHVSLVPDAKVILFLGNHEDWVRQYIDVHPEVEGMLEVERGLRLRERGFTVVPHRQTYRIGKLWYIHGDFVNDYHAKKMATVYHRNLIYGHTHDIQSYTISSPLDIQDKVMAQSIGCLCNVNPHYMQGKPNRWQHGFHVAYIRPNGDFSGYTVPIVRGQFTFNGKTYDGR